MHNNYTLTGVQRKVSCTGKDPKTVFRRKFVIIESEWENRKQDPKCR